jgi:proline iminopeptidase
MAELINIRGKKIYIEELGKHHEETLLYIHGGPGASCLDFCFYQAKALAESIRVVTFDQRGVLRSDPLDENEEFGLDDLIQDCESIRSALGIKKWSVLGHSFGGYLALKYASQYPNVVNKIIYEAPCFDLKMSVRSLFQAAIKLLNRIGKEELIPECKEYLEGNLSGTELISKWGYFCSKIGEYNKDLIYLHNVNPEDLNSIYEQEGIDSNMWARTQLHTNKLLQEGLINQSILDLLPLVQKQSLLLHGQNDPVFCSKQKDRFLETKNGEIVIFENSGHFPRIEEPEKYSKEILRFIHD